MKTHSLTKWLCILVGGICLSALAALPQQAKLTASGGAASDDFGLSVAMSGDGNTAVVGAFSATVGGNTDQGAAYVYTRSGTTWTQQGRLVSSDGAELDLFGFRVALSSDGNTAIIGAIWADVLGNADQGAAYVFTRSGTNWTQQVKLVASDGAASENFTGSIALSDDGNTAIVGANSAMVGGNANQGAAYVFTRSGSDWSQQKKLTASDGAANDYFGRSVALSSDGNTAAVGANNATVGVNAGQGAAYVFTRSGADWAQHFKLTATDGASGDFFGSSVALGGDGNTAVVGASNAAVDGHAAQGAGYVFTRSGSFWTQDFKLTANDGAVNDNFGGSVALNDDGTVAMFGVGLVTVDGHATQGAAYVFSGSGAAWTQQAKLTASDGAAGDQFGASVALSSDGNTAIAGAAYATVGGNANQGAAYVFANSIMQFCPSAYGVSESAGSIILTVTRANGASGAASVNYATADGTALAGTDYTAASGTLTWADGDAGGKTVTIPILNRSGTQAERVFTVNLSGASGAVLGSASSAVVTITEALFGLDVLLNGSEGPLTLSEGSELAVTVSLSPAQYENYPVDLWMVASTPAGLYYMNSVLAWTTAGSMSALHPVYQGGLFALQPHVVLDTAALPAGTYTFYFGVDPLNGILDPDVIYESASVIITP